ncbi:hypothetical protein L195_g039492 [Trifolium pratense]|uniref:Uncharacterized protein n=1 Tax=Trifolium pratense TaxID=57577 RepID=A0A2K3LY37_TRIPR|nr:hypothetical protein L195_g039492 [Trifolium pratense]
MQSIRRSAMGEKCNAIGREVQYNHKRNAIGGEVQCNQKRSAIGGEVQCNQKNHREKCNQSETKKKKTIKDENPTCQQRDDQRKRRTKPN